MLLLNKGEERMAVRGGGGHCKNNCKNNSCYLCTEKHRNWSWNQGKHREFKPEHGYPEYQSARNFLAYKK